MGDIKEIMFMSLKSGSKGAAAGVAQVLLLMPMRTTMNFQYRNGGELMQTIKSLYKEGGARRFYKGLLPALFQAPASRFGDTFANTFALAVCNGNKTLREAPVVVQTMFASVTAGSFRIILSPIDTIKTSLQVNNNLTLLKGNYIRYGPKVFFNGSVATSTATIVGHYPWFLTFNVLNENLPKTADRKYNLGRNAFIGFSSSIISDTLSNSFRVLKTTKQTAENANSSSYISIAKHIVKKDGIRSFFGRGLPLRLITNGIQGILFSVLWRLYEE